MAYQQKENSASLFKNDKKTAENHPNANGSALIDGREYWVAAWTKRDKNGNPWQSLSFTPKEQQQTKPRVPSAGKRDGGASQMDDDVPFAPIGRGIAGHAE